MNQKLQNFSGLETPELLAAEVEQLKKELLTIGRQLEDLELENDRLEIRLELEEKAKSMTNCSDLADLTENLDSLLQIRMKKTSVRPSNSFDEFKSTLARIKSAITVHSQVPTRSPIPAEKWKPRSTKAPKLIPVAVETNYEKQQRNGVVYDRVTFRTERAKKRAENKKNRVEKQQKQEKSGQISEIRFPLIDLKLAAFGRDPPTDKEHSFEAKFDLDISNTIDKNAVQTLLQMQLADLFSGYNLDVAYVANKVTVKALQRNVEGELAADVVQTMLNLLPHFLQESYSVEAKVANIEVIVHSGAPKAEKIVVGNPVSLQLLENSDQLPNLSVSLKTVGTQKAQAGLDRHNLLRNNHEDTPLMFHDENLCRDAKAYAQKLAEGDGSIRHDFSELVNLGQGENLFRLDIGQGRLSLQSKYLTL